MLNVRLDVKRVMRNRACKHEKIQNVYLLTNCSDNPYLAGVPPNATRAVTRLAGVMACERRGNVHDGVASLTVIGKAHQIHTALPELALMWKVRKEAP